MEHLVSLAGSVACKPCAAGDLSFFEEADKDEKASDGSSLHHKPLHRFYSYMRMAGAKTLVREERFEPWGPFLRDDNALAKRLGIAGLSSEWVRLSFFTAEFSRIDDLRHMCDVDYLGYCILRKIPDHRDKVGSLQRLQIWEAILKPTPVVNSYLHTARVYEGYVGCDKGSEFRVRGSYYAQQDGATSICSHVALMTVLNDMRETGSELIRAADIDEKLGIDHSDPKQQLGDQGGGRHGTLNARVHERILDEYGFLGYRYEFLGSPMRDYSEFVYPFVESGCGCVLHFGRMASGMEETDDAHGHVVPVVGHTFNSDLWMPEAGLGYGVLRPDHSTILDSRRWVDHYLIHDDNYGMYMNLPTLALKQETCPAETPRVSAKHGAAQEGEEEPLVAKYAVAALPRGVLMYARDAVLRSTGLMCFFRDSVGRAPERWLPELFRALETGTETGVSGARAGAGRRARAPVLRPLLVDKEHLLDHWAKVNAFSPDDEEARQEVESALPEMLWLVEASISEILTVNRSKIMDFAIDASRHFESNAEPWKACPVVRAPSGFFFPRERWRSLRAYSGDTYVPICRNPRNPPPPER